MKSQITNNRNEKHNAHDVESSVNAWANASEVAIAECTGID